MTDHFAGISKMIRRRAAHRALVLLAAIPWLLAMLLLGAALALVVLADRVWPDADHGNCWSFAGPRWWKYGGYLMVRPAHPFASVMHAIVVHRLDPLTIEQTVPVHRATRWWQVLSTVYFRFRVVRTERPRNSNWADL